MSLIFAFNNEVRVCDFFCKFDRSLLNSIILAYDNNKDIVVPIVDGKIDLNFHTIFGYHHDVKIKPFIELIRNAKSSLVYYASVENYYFSSEKFLECVEDKPINDVCAIVLQ